MQKINSLFLSVFSLIDLWLRPVAWLAVRIYIGWVFFSSGLLKLKDWDSTLQLFEYVYEFSQYELAAYMAVLGEIILPILLFLGLATRFGAAGLFVMTFVIEFFVFPGTNDHYFWFCILGLLFVNGGGALSGDALYRKFMVKEA
jgi:putative oxidoreductase